MADFAISLNSLGSGSSGNSFFIDTPGGALLVDQGFSRKELLARMEAAQCDPARIRGALLTHEHSDHSKGARVFCDMFDIPLYTTMQTVQRLAQNNNLPKSVRTFEAGASFDIAGINISTFPLPHDVDTVGFTIRSGKVAVGIATDLGSAGAMVRRALANCHALIIESNYDRQMLMASERSPRLKRRICGFRGHLENCYTAELLPELLGEETGLLLLAHVSRECNDPDMLHEFCGETLRKLRREIRYSVLAQDRPSEKYVFDTEGKISC